MRRLAIHSAIALTLVALGWAAGRAQPRSGDFELVIEGEVGTTRIECIRGCTLLGSRDITLVSKPPEGDVHVRVLGPEPAALLGAGPRVPGAVVLVADSMV